MKNSTVRKFCLTTLILLMLFAAAPNAFAREYMYFRLIGSELAFVGGHFETSRYRVFNEYPYVDTSKNGISLDYLMEGGGHCVVGYHLQDVDDTHSLLYIYDSNYPEKKRYIELKRSPEGAYTGWSYTLEKGKRIGSDIDGCSISSVPYRHIEKIWSDYLSRKTSTNQSSLLMVHSDAFVLLDTTGKEIARMQNGIFTSRRADVYQANLFFGTEIVEEPVYIYLPSTLEVTVKSLRQGRKKKSVWEAVLAGKDCSVRIRTDSRQIRLSAANAKTCFGTISAKKGTTYQISITTKAGGKRRRTTASGRGNGNTVRLRP